MKIFGAANKIDYDVVKRGNYWMLRLGEDFNSPTKTISELIIYCCDREGYNWDKVFIKD
jgi:hypothetical protein